VPDALPRLPVEDAPPIDPEAIEDAYRYHRARRRAAIERRRRVRWAAVRFWLVLLLLVAASAVILVTVWGQVQQLFGL
jgi:hypothetical protein